MTADTREGRVQLSVLDRLLDDDPKNQQEAPPTRAQSVRTAREALRRDLEWLLNTRAYADAIEDEMVELKASILAYGLPDFSSCSATSDQTRKRLEDAMRRAVATFEPRLFGIAIEAAPSEKGEFGTLRFRISGWFRTAPAPIQVSFDTRLELARGKCRVQGE